MGDRFLLVTGALVAAISVSPPVDASADAHLVTHMIQHVVLVSVAAPLLGVGVARLLAASPSRLGRSWRAVADGPRWPAALGTAAVLHVVLLVGWHAPGPFDAAVHHDALHALEHLTMLATAVAFWALVVPAVALERRGLAVVTVFVLGLAVGMLGVAMTLAKSTWYAAYSGSADALEEQQLAGVVMWAYGGLAGIVAGITLFVSWLAAQERAAQGWPPGAAVLPRGGGR